MPWTATVATIVYQSSESSIYVFQMPWMQVSVLVFLFCPFQLASPWQIVWAAWEDLCGSHMTDVLSETKVHISLDIIFASRSSHNGLNYWVLFSGLNAFPPTACTGLIIVPIPEANSYIWCPLLPSYFSTLPTAFLVFAARAELSLGWILLPDSCCQMYLLLSHPTFSSSLAFNFLVGL